MNKQKIFREYVKAKANTRENEKPAISYIKLTFILLIIGVSPVILLIICYPLFLLFKCSGQIGSLSCNSSFVTTIATFASELSWCVLITAPAMFVLWLIITAVRAFKFMSSPAKNSGW